MHRNTIQTSELLLNKHSYLKYIMYSCHASSRPLNLKQVWFCIYFNDPSLFFKIQPLGPSKKVRREAQRKCEDELVNEMGESTSDVVPRSTHQALQQRLQALEVEMKLLKEQVEHNKEPTADTSCSSNLAAAFVGARHSPTKHCNKRCRNCALSTRSCRKACFKRFFQLVSTLYIIYISKRSGKSNV